MPTLDSCVNSIFEPGNIGSSSGTTPTVIGFGSLYTPDNFPWDTWTDWRHDFSKFSNSFIHHHRVR